MYTAFWISQNKSPAKNVRRAGFHFCLIRRLHGASEQESSAAISWPSDGGEESLRAFWFVSTSFGLLRMQGFGEKKAQVESPSRHIRFRLCCEHFFFWVFSVFGLCVPHANSVSVYFSFSLVVYRSFHYWFVLGEFDFTNISVIYLSYDVVSYQLSYYFMS